MTQTFYRSYGKRCLDVVCSSLGLLVLSPLFLVCGILIKLSSSGPVFFRQVRTGINGTKFRMYKFRSMRNLPPGKTASLLTASGDSRVTAVGRLLRKTKVDELPQLINVLVGDMSLVGPRPEVPLYTDQYTTEQRTVLSMRPGITGIASVAFASEEQLLAQQEDKEHFYLTTLMPAKLALELQYLQNLSFSEDTRLLLQTFLKPLDRSKVPTVPVITQGAAGIPK